MAAVCVSERAVAPYCEWHRQMKVLLNCRSRKWLPGKLTATSKPHQASEPIILITADLLVQAMFMVHGGNGSCRDDEIKSCKGKPALKINQLQIWLPVKSSPQSSVNLPIYRNCSSSDLFDHPSYKPELLRRTREEFSSLNIKYWNIVNRVN